MRPFNRVKMLNADEYRVLKKTAHSRKMAAGKVRRAKIVLLSNQGLTAREIAERLDCNERTALKWIGRFNRHGVAGLEEVLREGPTARVRSGGRRRRDSGRAHPAAGAGTPVRLLDAGPVGGIPQGGEGRRHGTDEGGGGALRRGVEVAQAGGVVRRAGRPRVRRKKE